MKPKNKFDPSEFDCPPLSFGNSKETGWTLVAKAIFADHKSFNLAKKWIYEEDNWKEKLTFQGYTKYLERK